MKRNNKRITNIVVVFIIFFISLGYAYLTSNLSITGSASVAGNTWDIHFTNLAVNEGSVTATTPASIDASDNTKINYSAKLEKPGDFYEFTVDVKNFGTLPGKVSVVSLTGIDDSYSSFLECFVGYSKYREVKVNDLLNPNDYKNITVRVAYKEDIDGDDLPGSTISLNLSFQVTYVQSDKYEAVMLTRDEIDSTTNLDNYKNNIDMVIFSNSIVDFSNAVEVWDFGVFPNTIKASLVPSFNNDSMYILYIFGDGNVLAPRDSSKLFTNLFRLTGIYGLDTFDTYNARNMEAMFLNTGMQSSAFHLNLGDNFDTSNVTNMKDMFNYTGYNDSNFTLDLGGKFDTSNVTSMYMMFWKTGYHSNYFTLDLKDKFNTRNVTTMYYMFRDTGYSCPVFTLNLGNNFDTSNVTIMNSMFFQTGDLSPVFTLDLKDKFDTSKVVDMNMMFYRTGVSNSSFTLNLGKKFKLDSAQNLDSVFFYVAENNPNFELDLSSVDFKDDFDLDFLFGFKATQRLYVKNEIARDFVISHFNNINDNVLTTENVLIKS